MQILITNAIENEMDTPAPRMLKSETKYHGHYSDSDILDVF